MNIFLSYRIRVQIYYFGNLFTKILIQNEMRSSLWGWLGRKYFLKALTHFEKNLYSVENTRGFLSVFMNDFEVFHVGRTETEWEKDLC